MDMGLQFPPDPGAKGVQLESSWVQSPEKGIWTILQVLFR